MTMQENDNGTVSFETGQKTIGEADFFITTTPTGLYRIEARGEGANPKISEEHFTSLHFAKQAIQRYLNENEAVINKKQFLKKRAAERKEAYESSQGQ